MLAKLFRNPIFWLLLLIFLAVGGSYYIFGRGQKTSQRQTSTIQIVATANIAAEGQPVRPFAALDPAVEQRLLNQNQMANPNSFSFLPADVLPLGTYLVNVNPAGLQFELSPPPPFLNPLDNQLVSDFSEIPIISDAAGLVELLDYAGDGCAPAGLPVSGVLTQRYNLYHSAIDIGVPLGTPIVATHSGTVTFAGWSAYGYGYLVTLQNGSFGTYYAHLTNFNVRIGDQVGAGSIIGWSGSTGNSTGPHLHYETLLDGVAVDPLTFEARGYATC